MLLNNIKTKILNRAGRHFFDDKNRAKNSAGFTLIELLIYMGLSAVFVVIITEILVATVNTRLEAQAYSSLESDYRFLSLKLPYDLKSASAITAPTVIGTPATTLSITINGQTHTYAKVGDKLVVTNSYGQNSLTSSETKVTNFSVTRYGLNGKYVRLTIALESATLVNGQPKTKVLNFTAGTI